MRVFVAGGTGQLGLAAIPELVRAGHQVTATARAEDKAEQVRRLGAEPVEVDLFDVEALRGAIRGTDAVLRLTTKIPPMTAMRRRKSWDANNRLRTEGARALADAILAEGVGRYVSESVAYLYSGNGDDWVDEGGPVDDAGVPVLAAALASEAEAARITTAGATGVVLRFGSFYSATSEQTQQIASLVRKRMFPVIGAGDNYYASIAVSDAGAAVAASLDLPAGIYNVVDDQPVRYRDYVGAFVAIMGASKPLRMPRVAGRAVLGDPAAFLFRSSRVSNGRLKKASGWVPSYPTVLDGLTAIAPDLRSA